MRLTLSDKDAFVQAVMDDVPKIDYAEQVRSLLKKWGVEALPEDLQPMVKKYPEMFKEAWISTPDGISSAYVLAPNNWHYDGFKKHEPEKYAQLEVLSKASSEQARKLSSLRTSVTELIETCTTLKTAKERLPEFEKYLPADRDAKTLVNLPVANTVADLMNAGWPKGVVQA